MPCRDKSILPDVKIPLMIASLCFASQLGEVTLLGDCALIDAPDNTVWRSAADWYNTVS